MLKAWYRNSLIPRLVFIPYWITWLALLLLSLIRWMAMKRRSADRVSTICMEAGARGWELIEFKELYASACEYLDSERIHKIVINRDEDYGWVNNALASFMGRTATMFPGVRPSIFAPLITYMMRALAASSG